MIEEKPCKGTGIAKGIGCNKNVASKIRRKGLCPECYRAFIFSGSPEGEEEKSRFFALNKLKVTRFKKEKDKEQRKTAKKEKIESLSIQSLIVVVKEPFQKLIRIRDHRKSCICCGKPLPFNISDYNAGHFKKAEVYSGLIFHPDNVHGQLIYCNKYLNGNEANYAMNLSNRIGKERFDKLIELSITHKSYKWDRYLLLDMLKHYNNELRLVESGKKEPNEIDFSMGILE